MAEPFVDVVVRLDDAALSALDRWRANQADQPTRAEAIRRLVVDRLNDDPSLKPDDPENAGRAAFETYGSQGQAINPHDPGSADKSRWEVGFAKAKRGPKPKKP